MVLIIYRDKEYWGGNLPHCSLSIIYKQLREVVCDRIALRFLTPWNQYEGFQYKEKKMQLVQTAAVTITTLVNIPKVDTRLLVEIMLDNMAGSSWLNRKRRCHEKLGLLIEGKLCLNHIVGQQICTWHLPFDNIYGNKTTASTKRFK